MLCMMSIRGCFGRVSASIGRRNMSLQFLDCYAGSLPAKHLTLRPRQHAELAVSIPTTITWECPEQGDVTLQLHDTSSQGRPCARSTAKQMPRNPRSSTCWWLCLHLQLLEASLEPRPLGCHQ